MVESTSNTILLLKDVSKRASSESGESARSAVTYSSTKNSNSEKLSWPLAASKLEKLYRPNEKIFEVAETASSSIPRKVIFAYQYFFIPYVRSSEG